MKKIIAITALAGTTALSACHNGGIGVSATSNQQITARADSSIHRTRALSAGTKTSKSVQMSASVLAVAALRGWIASPDAARHPMHLAAAEAIIGTAHAVAGWPSACFDCAPNRSFAEAEAVDVNYANLVLTQTVAAMPSAVTLVDPVAAKAAIIAAFIAIPSDRLQELRVRAERLAHGGRPNLDFSGSGASAVHFLIGSDDYNGGPSGWTLASNGAPWYGSGALSGRNVQLSLASSIDRNMSKSSEMSTGSGVSGGEGSEGTVGVK